jgi:hypothetical protein
MGWQTVNAVVLHAGNTIINPNGIFTYSPSPGAGNLIFSVAPAGTTADSFGNAVVGGAAVAYATGDTGSYAELSNAVLLLNVAGANTPGEVNMQAAGFITMGSGKVTAGDTAANVSALSRSANGGQSVVALSSDTAQLVTGAAAIPRPVSGSILTLPNDTNSGSTWVSGERAFMNSNWVGNVNSNFNIIVNALVAAGIFS